MTRATGQPVAGIVLIALAAILASCLGPTEPSGAPFDSPAPGETLPGSPRPTPTPVPGAATAGPPGPSIEIPPPIH